MTIARCTQGCGWEVDVPGDEFDADAGRVRHEQQRCPNRPATPSEPSHTLGEPAQPIRQFPSNEWRTKALDALADLARTRPRFTIYEVVELGVGEPPNPSKDWGILTRDAEHMGLIKHARDDTGREMSERSKRPATKGSLVFVWTAGKAIAS